MTDDTNGAGQVPAASTTTDTPAGQVPGAASTSSTATTENTSTTDAATTTTADSATTSGKPTSLTLEQALDALEKARKDAAKNRVDSKRLAELEDAQRKADLAKLDEKQRLEKELADLQAAHAEVQRTYQERLIKTEVRAAAMAAGIPPELANRLIDYAEITFGDDGEPENIGKLLTDLVKKYPQLAGNANSKPAASPQPTSVGSNPANPPRSTAHSGALSHEYIDSLTSQQFADLPAERRQEILNWLAVNPKSTRPY